VSTVIGWDIGGAHLKAARAEAGRITAVMQVPSPLWQGLDRLDSAIAEAQRALGPVDRHAATMTGELADVFANRAEGVAIITARLAEAVAPAPLAVYAGRAGFVATDAVAAHVADIASANWHATASLAARHVGDGLLVDMGSTTTDIIPLISGKVAAAGYTDAARLASGELVYTGLTRSFVTALAARAPFAGGWTPLANEYFATSGDLYRILGELDEDVDQMATADGREKTVGASIARLARMIGRDATEADADAWRALAAWFAECQLRQIADGAALVLSRARLQPSAPIVSAGIGGNVVVRLAARLGRSSRPLATLLDVGAVDASRLDQCAPAVAIALLAG